MRSLCKLVLGVLIWPLALSTFVTAQQSSSVPPNLSPPTHRTPILAHYVNWHRKSARDNSWVYASTVPVRQDAQGGPGYDSLDLSILREHNKEMILHGILPIISWWGPEQRSGDEFLDTYLSLPGPQMGLLYEVTGRLFADEQGHYNMDDQRNIDRFIGDMQHLQARYWSRPEFADRWFRLEGKPVLFIWLSHAFTGSFERIRAALATSIPLYIVGSDFNLDQHFKAGLQSVLRGMDAVSSYGIYHPSLAIETGGQLTPEYVERYVQSYKTWVAWLKSEAPSVEFIPPVQFAFQDDRGNPVLRSTRSQALDFLQTLRVMMEESRACGEPVQPFLMLASYNEHFEGSAIEATLQYGTDWLEVLAEAFGTPVSGLRPCPSVLGRTGRPGGFGF